MNIGGRVHVVWAMMIFNYVVYVAAGSALTLKF